MSSEDPRGGDQLDDEQQIEEELSWLAPPPCTKNEFYSALKLSGTIVHGSLQSAPIKHAALAQQRPAFPASSPVSIRKENPLSLGQQQKIGIHRRWLGLAWAFFPIIPMITITPAGSRRWTISLFEKHKKKQEKKTRRRRKMFQEN